MIMMAIIIIVIGIDDYHDDADNGDCKLPRDNGDEADDDKQKLVKRGVSSPKAVMHRYTHRRKQ